MDDIIEVKIPELVYKTTLQLEEKTVKPQEKIIEVIPYIGFDGLEKVVVEAVNLQERTIEPMESEQTIVPSEGFDGLKSVKIKAIKTNLQDKIVEPSSTEIQTISADNGFTGLNTVTVNKVNLEEINIEPINQDASYIPENAMGFSRVFVNLRNINNELITTLDRNMNTMDNLNVLNNSIDIKNIKNSIKIALINKGIIDEDTKFEQYPEKIQEFKLNLKEKTITQNGTYNADDDNVDGYSSVTVNTPRNIAPSIIDRSVTTINAEDLQDITTIGSYAFYGCSGLTNITIPDSVIDIKNGSFANCISLMNITIPKNVTNIGNGAFNNSGLISIRSEAIIPPILGNVPAIPSNIQYIFVPQQGVEAYKTATNWSNFADKIVGY